MVWKEVSVALPQGFSWTCTEARCVVGGGRRAAGAGRQEVRIKSEASAVHTHTPKIAILRCGRTSVNCFSHTPAAQRGPWGPKGIHGVPRDPKGTPWALEAPGRPPEARGPFPEVQISDLQAVTHELQGGFLNQRCWPHQATLEKIYQTFRYMYETKGSGHEMADWRRLG